MSDYSFIPNSHCVYVLDDQSRSDRNGLAFMVSEHDKFVKAEQYENRLKTAQKWAGQKFHKIFVDNTPKSGFKVISKQTRYSTSNVVWRISHPEGFTFEISSENLSEILEHCSIIDKEIIGNLFFNTAGFLYNENFDLYKEQVKLVELTKNIKNSQKVDLVPGDIIESKAICDYESVTLEYLGRYHCLTLNDDSSFLVHCFINIKDESVMFYKKLDNIIRHEKRAANDPKYTKEEAIKIISNKILYCESSGVFIKGTYKSSSEVIAVSPTPFKMSDIKIEYIPMEYKYKYTYNCRHRCAVKDDLTGLYYAYNSYNYCNVSDMRSYTSVFSDDISSFRTITIRGFDFPCARMSQDNDKENFHLVNFIIDKPKKK